MTSVDFTYIIAFAAGLIYLYFVNWLWSGFKKARNNSVVKPVETVSPLSVLIAAHNEENSISLTLDSLENQYFPKEKF